MHPDEHQAVMSGDAVYYATRRGTVFSSEHAPARTLHHTRQVQRERRVRGRTILIGMALAAACMVTLVVLHKLAGKQLKGLIPLGVLSLYAFLFHKLVPDFAV